MKFLLMAIVCALLLVALYFILTMVPLPAPLGLVIVLVVAAIAIYVIGRQAGMM